MPDDIKKTVVQIDWDNTSAKRVEGGTTRVKHGLEETKKTVQALGRDLGITDKRLEKYGKTAKGVGRHIDELVDDLDDADKAARDFDKTIGSADGVKQLEEDARAARIAFQQLEDSMRATEDASVKVTRDAAGRYGDIATRGRDVAGLLPIIGGAGGQQGEQLARGAADILDGVEGIKLLRLEAPKLAAQMGLAKLSATQLGLGIGVIGIASVAAVVAIKLIGEASKEAQQTAQAQIETQRQLAELQIAGLTTAEINAEKQAIEDLNETRRDQRASLEKTRRELFLSLGDLEKYGEITGVANQGLDDYTNRIDELTKEVDSSSAVWIELDNALGDATTAANDAAEAERQLASERETQVTGRIAKTRRELEADAEIQRRVATFTEDQRQARLDEVDVLLLLEQATQDKIQKDLERGKIEGDIVDDARNASELRAFILREERRSLEGVIKSSVEAREQEAAATDLVTESLELSTQSADTARKAYQSASASQDKLSADLTAFEEKRLQDTEDFARKTIEIGEDRDLKLAQNAEKAALKRVNDLADHYKDLADQDLDYYEEVNGILQDTKDGLGDIRDESLEAQIDFNKESIRNTKDHLDRIAQIQRNAQRALQGASLRLDAVAIYEAGLQREDELRAENEQYDKEQERRDEDFQAQQEQYQKERQERKLEGQQDLADLRRKHIRERNETIAAFQESNRRENQQRQLEGQQQRQQWALEDTRRNNQNNHELEIAGKHYSALLTRTTDGLFQVELAYKNWLALMTEITVASTPVGTVSTPVGVGTLPAFTAGNNGPAMADFSPSNGAAPRGAGSVNITEGAFLFNIPGAQNPAMTGRAIMEQVEPAMIELFNQIAGV